MTPTMPEPAAVREVSWAISEKFTSNEVVVRLDGMPLAAVLDVVEPPAELDVVGELVVVVVLLLLPQAASNPPTAKTARTAPGRHLRTMPRTFHLIGSLLSVTAPLHQGRWSHRTRPQARLRPRYVVCTAS